MQTFENFKNKINKFKGFELIADKKTMEGN